MENEATETTSAPESFSEHGTEEQLGKLYGALARAMGEFLPIDRTRTVRVQTKTGGAYTFDYAEMDEINRAIGPALKAHGLAMITPFHRGGRDSRATLTVQLMHEAGGRIRSCFSFDAGADVKDLGGQTTYIMRYMTSKFLRLHADGDSDDMPTRANEVGVEASRREPQRDRQAPPKVPAPKAEPAPAPKVPAPKAKPQAAPVEVVDEPPADNAPVLPETKAELREAIARAKTVGGWSSDDLREFCVKVTGLSPAEAQNLEASARKLISALAESEG
jgi:hypothetical protein